MTESADAGRLRRFAEVDLSHGDRIAVGDTMFECRVDVAVAPTVLVEPKRAAPPPTLLRTLPWSERRACAPPPPAERPSDGWQGGDLAAYEVVKSLAKGGMAEVFLVRRRSDGAELALKTMLPEQAFDAPMRAMFLREVDIMRDLRHPGIVALHDVGETNGTFWFVMELCRGGSVEDYMKARGGLPLPEVHRIVCQALEGLAFAHQHPKCFVHRDLKPANLLLSSVGGPVKVSDFGIAKSFQQAGLSGLTVTGRFAGTLDFMPREQLINFKRMRPVSDVWSMAATYYFLATGALPREVGPGQDPIGAILTSPVRSIRERASHIPAALGAIIDRCLSDDVSRRPNDAAALLLELRSHMLPA